MLLALHLLVGSACAGSRRTVPVLVHRGAPGVRRPTSSSLVLAAAGLYAGDRAPAVPPAGT